MILIPRSTSQRFSQFCSKASRVTPSNTRRMRSITSMISARRGATIRSVTKDQRGGFFDPLSQQGMQTVARQDNSLPAEDAGGFLPSRPLARTDRACLFHGQKRSPSESFPASSRAAEPNILKFSTPNRFKSPRAAAIGYGFVSFHNTKMIRLGPSPVGLSPDRCSGGSVCGRLIVLAQVRRDTRRIGSFAGLFFSRFSKPNTAATAVLVDELDACEFQRQT